MHGYGFGRSLKKSSKKSNAKNGPSIYEFYLNLYLSRAFLKKANKEQKMTLQGTNQELGRPYNRRIVLEALRQHGAIARADIAGRVGLTVQTVSNIVRELEDQNYFAGVRECPKSRSVEAA